MASTNGFYTHTVDDHARDNEMTRMEKMSEFPSLSTNAMKKQKTNNSLPQFSILSDFSTLSMALKPKSLSSNWRFTFLQLRNHCFKRTVMWPNYYLVGNQDYPAVSAEFYLICWQSNNIKYQWVRQHGTVKKKGDIFYNIIFTLRMAWTVWRGYVAVVAMALAMAPMRKISAEDIYGGRQRFNKLPSVFFFLQN